MKRNIHMLLTPACTEAACTAVVSVAISSAERFITALRFYFFGYYFNGFAFSRATICEDRPL